MPKTTAIIRRNAVSLAAVLALGVSAAGVVATADAQPAAGLRSTDVRTLKAEPYDRAFHVRADDPEELKAAWRDWKRLGIGQYETVVQRSCFCVPRKAVWTRVLHGDVRAVGRVDHPHQAIPRAGWTIDRFFYVLRHAYATADEVSVTFGVHGVPRSIGIDRDKLMADEEVYYRVTLRQPVGLADRPLTRMR